jgi:hypothetical protein
VRDDVNCADIVLLGQYRADLLDAIAAAVQQNDVDLAILSGLGSDVVDELLIIRRCRVDENDLMNSPPASSVRCSVTDGNGTASSSPGLMSAE